MVAIDTAKNGCERLIPAGEIDPDLAMLASILLSEWPKLSPTAKPMAKRMILAALEASHEGEQSGSAAPHGKGVAR